MRQRIKNYIVDWFYRFLELDKEFQDVYREIDIKISDIIYPVDQDDISGLQNQIDDIERRLYD